MTLYSNITGAVAYKALPPYLTWGRGLQPVARPASPPPLSELQIRYGHPISSDRHQLYIVIEAKPYAWLLGAIKLNLHIRNLPGLLKF
jgi:hypothetical protein